MELVLFSKSGGGSPGVHLHNLLARLPHLEEVEIFRTVEGLAARLRHPAIKGLIVVLLASSRQELEDLQVIRHVLGKARVFLVIPDGEDDTIVLAHRLRPRYLGYLSDDLQELAEVLGKMLQERDGSRPARAPSDSRRP
jgi:hypothetical protein